MAYLRNTDRNCACGKRAVVELFNQWNAPIDWFCRSCGNQRLKQLRASENRDREERP